MCDDAHTAELVQLVLERLVGRSNEHLLLEEGKRERMDEGE